MEEADLFGGDVLKIDYMIMNIIKTKTNTTIDVLKEIAPKIFTIVNKLLGNVKGWMEINDYMKKAIASSNILVSVDFLGLKLKDLSMHLNSVKVAQKLLLRTGSLSKLNI